MGGEPVRSELVSAKMARALRLGRFPYPGACENCGCPQGGKGRRQVVVWHHWSYLVEHHFDVIPLCRKCHRKVHDGTIPEPRTGRRYPTRRERRYRSPAPFRHRPVP